jgi:CheY-like chemotaxis protein
VEIAVSDTGTGMSSEVQSHIFEPFFTTKSGEKGTGLGLAMVHGFVTQSGGDIHVQSAAGRGTTFRILLPVVLSPADEDTVPRLDASVLQGHETVLLVEDEGPVRDLLRSSLVAFGYRVIECADGMTAIQRIQDSNERFDAVVTDMVMPRARGRQVLEAIARSRPGTPVVAISGYPGDSLMPPHIEGQPFEFLQKPFQPAELAHRLRHLLEERARRSA